MPIATVALIISALVFAPLASYLAGRRARSAAMWFLLGVVLGPLAIVLLLFAPPGRCPDCGERVRGWPRTCNVCGAALAGAVELGPPAPATDRPVDDALVVRPVGASAATGARPTSTDPRPVLVALPPVSDRSTTVRPLAMPTEDRSRELAMPAATSAAAVAASADRAQARARGRRPPNVVDPDAIMIGSAIFLGGSAPTSTNVVRLEVGDRYGLARDGDELHVLGPISFDPDRIVARVPIGGATVEVTADRLVVQGGPAGRGTLLAFTGIATPRGTDIAAILTAPAAASDG